ncbi:MAG: type II CRISPR RNA-guided endonuclease Cas9, partial [Bacteroidetes bacterium]|nr:type II CRISPR RNA-guided endonuclease Cas9 [Bacteroidota bacterium]
LQRLDREKSFNQSLYVKTGGNYCFAILEKEGKRIYDIISFYDAANILKDEFKNAEDKLALNTDSIFKNHFQEKNKGAKTLFLLKQNDIVYLPQNGEEVILDTESPLFKGFWEDKNKIANSIFSVVKFSKKQIYFIIHTAAKSIENKVEFGSQNCYEIINGISIKDKCIPIKLNRLGGVIEVNGEKWKK